MSVAFAFPLGEIGNMLRAEADNLRPEYERLKKGITEQEVAHLVSKIPIVWYYAGVRESSTTEGIFFLAFNRRSIN